MGAVGSSSQDLIPTPTLIFKDSGKQYATSRPIFYEQVMDSSSSDFSPSSDYSESSYFSSESSSSSSAPGPKSASVTKKGSIVKSTSTTSPTTKVNSSSIWNTTKATNYGILEDDRFVIFVGCGIAGLLFMLLLLIAVLVGHRHRRRKNSRRDNVTVIHLNTQPSRGCYVTGVMTDRSHNFVNTRPSCPPVPQQDKRDECYYEAISSTMPTPSIYEQPRETATYNDGCTMSFQSANVRTNAQNTQDDYLIPLHNPSTRGQYVASDSPYLAVSD
ncbi:uncharacterized protein [Apostichopus japonicus]|uniref:uncharacterized protein isoform X2 n=1 Tax=Stichopus japonicus TaxID=307972 RepID=UPI003AB61888